MIEHVLELRHVSCAYHAERPAIADVSLSVSLGEILCLLGPSGCGKTTTLRAIAGFEPVTAGEIYVKGRLVSSPQLTIPTQRRRIGMVFQEYALFPHLTVQDNIAFGLHELSSTQRSAEVDQLMALIGMTGLGHRYPHEISGGQQQRVALARALARRPHLLLLDEPFSNLDPDMRGHMRTELQELLRQTKTTAILVTHDHDEAFAIADRIAVLNQGRLEQCDIPEAIYHAPATPFVADFVGQADFIPGIVHGAGVITEIGTFHNNIHAAAGTQLRVMIRPGDVRLAMAEQSPLRIIGRQFRGFDTVYTIKLASGLLLHVSDTSMTAYPMDSAVMIQIIPTRTVFFPRTAADTLPGSATS